MAWKAPSPSQSPMDPPIAESSSLTDGVSSSVIVIVTFSEKEKSIRPSGDEARFETRFDLVLKVVHGIGQLDNVLPLYKFFTFSRYPGGCQHELYVI